ncbi:MAG: T9SS type A sorting domain-containing protein [Bacteroidales bacterium]|nr:T9SS type A sorting domain-containing protein [Bacteroidales bacterium]
MTSFFISLFSFGYLFGQVEEIIVEKYYIADSTDASDTTFGHLEEGAVTYRIFVDLADGVKLRGIYGDANHTLHFMSSRPFFNNTDRGQTFGFDIRNTALDENKVALDTWITMAFASNKHFGILKEEDIDGTVLDVNDMGLLKNTDPGAGIPLTAADGLERTDTTVLGFSSGGFVNLISGTDSTIFGNVSKDTFFISNNVFLRKNPGISLPENGNKILVAQLTTKSEIAFELNLEVLVNGSIIKVVAKNPSGDEIFSPFLTYPGLCGCTDPEYIEFNKSATCDDGSCKTLKVIGCTDPDACNYDPNATYGEYNQYLCCYDSKCALELGLVCPGVIYGCNDPGSYNYNPLANRSSETDSCCYEDGCMDINYLEYRPDVCFHVQDSCKILKIEGCMIDSACNYNPVANINKGCIFDGCKKNVTAGYSINIFPNPANDFITVDIETKGKSSVSFVLCDIYSRPFYNKSSIEINGKFEESINLSGFPNGIYILKFYINGNYLSKAIIKK